MAPRPNWKGYLKLSLVSCPIALYPATSAAERVSFRQINKKTGNRLKQQLVDSETGDPVDSEDKGRGYEVGRNEFIVVDDAELRRSRSRAHTRLRSTDSFPTLRSTSGTLIRPTTSLRQMPSDRMPSL
jgi:DNA end-binding protein Ku